MAWTTIKGTEDNIDEEVEAFEATVTSIDAFSVASESRGELVALVEYTA